MKERAENPFASPASDPERRVATASSEFFEAEVLKSWKFPSGRFRFYINPGQLLATPLEGTSPGGWLLTIWWILPLLAFYGAMFGSPMGQRAASSDRAAAGAALVVLLIVWVAATTFVLLRREWHTRNKSQLLAAAPRNLEAFKAIDDRCFEIRADQLRSLQLVRHGGGKKSRYVEGMLILNFLAAARIWRPLRIVVVGPHDMEAIREELVAAGFPLRN